jgi:PleD family two-component response regulator
VLSGTALDNAILCAERVRKAVARLSIFTNEPTFVSGGVAQLIPGEQLAEAVSRAEGQVKAAKADGGNRIR